MGRLGGASFQFFIGITLALFLSVGAFAADAGTSGAQFLKIGAGARPAAMGNAFTAVADDVNAVSFNPAGISNISRAQLTAMHTQWIQDINYDFAAFAYPTDVGAFAVSAATLKVDGVQRRDASETLLGNFDAMDAAYALTYSRNILPSLSMGVTARYIRQDIDSDSATAWAGDIGIHQRFKRMPLNVGLAIRNWGQDIKFRHEADPLPTTYCAGLSYGFFKERFKVAADIKKVRDADTAFSLGGELRNDITAPMRLALRAGYDSSMSDASGADGVAFGAGVGFYRLDFDFAWVPFGDLGNTFRYAALLRF